MPISARLFCADNLTSSRPAGESDVRHFIFEGRNYSPGKGTFKTTEQGLTRLAKSSRVWPTGNISIRYVRYFEDFPVIPFSDMWTDTGTGSFTDDKVYVVQTGTKVIERCLLMTTDPGDLVLDPTCGSGTTAFVAEQWGRRWITIDTSRVALALARARIMGARYPFYLLADSQRRTDEGSANRRACAVRYAHSWQRAPGICLRARSAHHAESIANNAEIDVIWEEYQEKLEPLREQLNQASKRTGRSGRFRASSEKWPQPAKDLHAAWWEQRIARQKAIDASIAAKAEFEYLYDKPYEDKKKVRVAGPSRSKASRRIVCLPSMRTTN